MHAGVLAYTGSSGARWRSSNPCGAAPIVSYYLRRRPQFAAEAQPRATAAAPPPATKGTVMCVFSATAATPPAGLMRPSATGGIRGNDTAAAGQNSKMRWVKEKKTPHHFSHNRLGGRVLARLPAARRNFFVRQTCWARDAAAGTCSSSSHVGSSASLSASCRLLPRNLVWWLPQREKSRGRHSHCSRRRGAASASRSTATPAWERGGSASAHGSGLEERRVHWCEKRRSCHTPERLVRLAAECDGP